MTPTAMLCSEVSPKNIAVSVKITVLKLESQKARLKYFFVRSQNCENILISPLKNAPTANTSILIIKNHLGVQPPSDSLFL